MMCLVKRKVKGRWGVRRGCFIDEVEGLDAVYKNKRSEAPRVWAVCSPNGLAALRGKGGFFIGSIGAEEETWSFIAWERVKSSCLRGF